MDTNTKVTAILEALKTDYPESRCALQYKKDYELMVAVRLSAQCTDARVNEVTPSLFAAYPTLEALAEADISHVEELVHSCGFYKNKAREIVLACRMLLTDYGGKVPGTMEELLKLRVWDGKPPTFCWGICTMRRERWSATPTASGSSNRLGLAQGKEPEKVERQLRAILPPEESSEFCHRLVLHGRAVCTARSPKCTGCSLAPLCDYVNSAETD